MKYAKKMKTLEQLKKEATERGIVEGATIRTAWRMHDTRTAIVPSPNEWILHGNTDLTFRDNGDDVWIKDLDSGRWATVITPAPSKEEGLIEGDSVKCGPAMRAAIIELAKELGVEMHQPGINDIQSWPFLSWANGLLGGCNNANRVGDSSPNTPEAFMAKMRVTAAAKVKAEAEKPIKFGTRVEFELSGIKHDGRSAYDYPDKYGCYLVSYLNDGNWLYGSFHRENLKVLD